jgi:hypothetical protein
VSEYNGEMFRSLLSRVKCKWSLCLDLL